jgi:ankyrin repeat protein
MVKILLEAKANASTPDSNITLYTALHYAAENGHLDVVNMLINAGANVNAQTKYVRLDHNTPAVLYKG